MLCMSHKPVHVPVYVLCVRGGGGGGEEGGEGATCTRVRVTDKTNTA